MADETPELIEQRMHDTRQSLADKLAALETSVSQTLTNTTQSVQDTVNSLRSGIQEASGAVQDTVGGVRSLFGGGTSAKPQPALGGGAAQTPLSGLLGDNPIQAGIQSLAGSATEELKSAMDISPQVREKPWQYVGGAVAAGFVAGLLFTGGRRGAPAGPGYGAYSAPPLAAGIFDDLIKMLGQEVRKVGETAITSLTQSMNKSVREGVPRFVDTTVSRFVDAAGQAATATRPATEPVADPDLDNVGYGRQI